MAAGYEGTPYKELCTCRLWKCKLCNPEPPCPECKRLKEKLQAIYKEESIWQDYADKYKMELAALKAENEELSKQLKVLDGCLEEINAIIYESRTFWTTAESIERDRVKKILEQLEIWGAE